MPVLDVHTTILVYGDGEFSTNNPQRRYADWTRHFTSISVENPFIRDYVLMPGEELTAFSGVRSVAVDDTTAFDLSMNPVRDSTYRISWTGGTAPGFRTARALDLAGESVTVTINNNATATFALDPASLRSFASVSVGDIIFIPSVSTGDPANVFNPNNGGFWTVLAKTAKSVTLRRRVGEEFVGVSETVVLTDSSQMKAFSAAGVQKGDTMEISGGFSSITQKSFLLTEVSVDWVEFTSAEPLPLESGVITGSSGLTFYTDAKRFVRIEVDQEAIVRLNGDAGSSNRLSPRISGDPEAIAHFEKWGPCWQLVVVNRSTTSPMTLNVITAE